MELGQVTNGRLPFLPQRLTVMNAFRFLPLLALLPLLAACDASDYRDEEARVRSIEFTYSMRNADINGSVASVQYDVPEITARVSSGGAILAFFREQNTWTAMPYTFAVENPEIPAVDYTITLGYAFEERLLEVFYEASTPQAPLSSQPDRRVKLVIIDADVYSSKQGLDLTSWEAVKAAFDLED